MGKKPEFRIVDNVLIGIDAPEDRCVNVGELILDKLKSKPHFMAQVDATTANYNTFQDLRVNSVKCAIWLKRQGIKPGDTVGICVENNLQVSIPVFATLYVAAQTCGWDHIMSITYARFYLNLIKPKIVFVTAETAENLREAARLENQDFPIITVGRKDGFESLDDILSTVDSSEVDKFTCTPIKSSSDTAMICLSSGTTGMPKGAMLSHRSVLNSITPVEDVRINDEVVIWSPTVRWQFGICLLLEAILSEAQSVIPPDLDNDLKYFEYIDKFGITYFTCDPCVPIRWVKHNYMKDFPLRNLKTIMISGARFSAENQANITAALPHVNTLQCYGMTDACGLLVSQTPDCKPGSSGYVCRGVNLKIVDLKTGEALGPNQRGEVWVKTPYLMTGYLNNPEATKAAIDKDGWLHTNDLGYYDEDGEIFIVDRISEIIIYRAINLSPGEIETTLESHPSVMKAAVVGVKHETDDEHPMGFVTKVPGKEVHVDELKKLIKDHLPWYCELLAGLYVIDKMPMTTTGKIARKELKEKAKKLYAAAKSS